MGITHRLRAALKPLHGALVVRACTEREYRSRVRITLSGPGLDHRTPWLVPQGAQTAL
jgi:hypothetical protein